MATVSTDSNLSSISYAAGEVITIDSNATLTINSNLATRPGTIQCTTRGKLRVTNSSTTTPVVLNLNDNNQDIIVTGNAVFEVSGVMINIYTGTGAAGQTINFTSINGVLIDYPSYIEIETGNGTNVYRPWYILPTTGTTGTNLFANLNQVGTGVLGNFALYNEATRVMTFGDGTNGNVIPSGAKVRIPNIHITSNANVNAIASRSLLNLNPSGTATITNCSFSNAFNFAPTNFKNLNLTKVGWIGRGATIGFTSGGINFTNVINHPDARQGTWGLVMGTISGPAYLNNIYSINQATSLNLSISSLTDLRSCDGLEGVMYGRTATNNSSITLTNLSGTVTNVVGIGGRIFIDTCANVLISNVQYADQNRNITTAANAISAITASNSINVIVGNFSLVGAQCYSSLISFDSGCTNCVFRDSTIDAANHTLNLASVQGKGLTIANVTFNNSRTSPYFSTQSGSNIVLRNVSNNQAHSIQQTTGSIIDFVQAASVSTSLPNYNDSNPFAVVVDSPKSTGKLLIGAFGPKILNNIYTITGTEETDWYFNNNGSLYIVSSGIVATFRSIFSLRSITSFQNVAPSIVGNMSTGSFIYDFRIATPGNILAATWQTLNATNLSGAIASLTGYSSDTGFDMEVRLTSSGVDSARFISLLTLLTNNNAAFAPKVGSVTTSLINGIDGSVARFYDRTNPSSPVLLDKKTISSGTASLLGPYNFDGSTVPTSVRVYNYNYQRIIINSSYQNLNQSIPLSPTIDTTITETNPTVVDAYTNVSNLDRIRDCSKRWTDLNFELNYPTIDTGLLLATSPILDFGNLNLIITTLGSGSPFTVNTATNTITLRVSSNLVASSKYDTLKTTGSITLQGGATQGDVTLISNTGTTPPQSTVSFAVTFKGATAPANYEWWVYIDDVSAGVLGTNEIAGNENETSTNLSLTHSLNGTNVIFQLIANGFEEVIQPFTLTSSNQYFNIIVQADLNI